MKVTSPSAQGSMGTCPCDGGWPWCQEDAVPRGRGAASNANLCKRAGRFAPRSFPWVLLGEPAAHSASSRKMESSARVSLHKSLPVPHLPPTKVLDLPANQGWRMKKGKYWCSEMPQKVTTSLQPPLVVPQAPALVEGAWSMCMCTASLPRDTALPIEGTSATG